MNKLSEECICSLIVYIVSTYYIQRRLTNFSFVFQQLEGFWQYYVLKVMDLLDTVGNHLYRYSCNE
jgi:hypothetical protein